MTEGSISLEEIVARLGDDEVPEVLEAAATPVRRGHHVALLAGEGSGKSAVVGLAVLEACDPDAEALQALVLVPEAAHAWRLAAAVHRIVGPAGIVVSCPSASVEEERTGGEAVAAAAHVLVGRPSKLLPEIRAGHHSISNLVLLVLDGVADLHALQEWSSVEPILETLPKESRKLAISDRADPAFTELITRQLPRARRWPEELLPAAATPDEQDEEEGRKGGPVRCAFAPPAGFVEAFERCVRDADGLGCAAVRFVCRDARIAGQTASQLAVAGLEVAAGEAESQVVVTLPGEGAEAVVQVGLAPRFQKLVDAFDGEGPRYAVVEPRHVAQLALDLARLRRPMIPLRGQPLREALDPVRRYRMRVREALEAADLMSELLVLEPLFEEMGAVRVAAALSALLRQREDPDAAALRPWADVEAASTVPGWTPAQGARPGRGRTRQRSEEVPKGARPAWTRLYFGVGRRDEAKPGDLVGAITGETGIAGAQIGKVEIMGSFSLVDVDSQVADEVLRKLDGVQIRGRTVPVRHDRES